MCSDRSGRGRRIGCPGSVVEVDPEEQSLFARVHRDPGDLTSSDPVNVGSSRSVEPDERDGRQAGRSVEDERAARVVVARALVHQVLAAC